MYVVVCFNLPHPTSLIQPQSTHTRIVNSDQKYNEEVQVPLIGH